MRCRMRGARVSDELALVQSNWAVSATLTLCTKSARGDMACETLSCRLFFVCACSLRVDVVCVCRTLPGFCVGFTFVMLESKRN
jgi:hypothetical protein